MASRKVPQNVEAEMAVLGSVFLTDSAKDKVCEELTTHMFYLEAHKKIFEAIYELYEEGTPLDITTMKEKLEKKKNLTLVGGIDYLSEVIDSVATASNIDYYINIVREKAVLRNLIEVSTNIITDAYESADALNDILDKADKKFMMKDGLII